MKDVVRLLLIEDSSDDAELILRTLAREGHSISHRRVDTELELREALEGRWDLIISDFSMPRFDGLKAHEIVKAHDPLVPFIFVSGVLGEERAVAAMRSGARDYVLKDNMARLPPVVSGVLSDLDNQRKRVAAERALEYQQRRYQSIFETAPVALLEVDLSGARRVLASLGERDGRRRLSGDPRLLRRIVQRIRVLSANSAALDLAGAATAEQIIGPRQLGAGSAATWLELLDGLREGPGLISREVTMVTRQGERREVLVSCRLPAAARELSNVVVSIVDLSERNSMERQIRAAQRMEAIGRLAGGVAHDFNNLLTVIRGYAELMGYRMAEDDPNRRDLEQIDTAAESAEHLTRQLLAFSRRDRIDPEVLNVNERVAQIQSMLQRTLGEDVNLQFLPADDLWPVEMDPSHVEQVVMNLSLNARDAMPGGGRLVVETSNRPAGAEHPLDCVMVAVSDTGHGMDAATREQIFEPFFTTKEASRGTGLGLSIVQRIVTEAGGVVHVYSEPGHGSTFRVLLPRAADAEPERPSGGVSLSELRGYETVLLVEDEPLVRDIAEQMLEHAGYRVRVAEGSEQALEILAGEPEVRAMVTDVIMPGMNGRQLADRVAAVRPDVRVLFVSGYPSHTLTHQDLLADGADYLEKPYTSTTLLTRLREMLDRA